MTDYPKKGSASGARAGRGGKNNSTAKQQQTATSNALATTTTAAADTTAAAAAVAGPQPVTSNAAYREALKLRKALKTAREAIDR